jgi:hypothetical protein
VSNPSAIENHHLVPRRHGGPDADWNVVALCANCHRSVEGIYGDDFFEFVGFTPQIDDPDPSTMSTDEFEQLSVAVQVTILSKLLSEEYMADILTEIFTREYDQEAYNRRYGTAEDRRKQKLRDETDYEPPLSRSLEEL